jgi:DHA2 family multidrug resistance protein-like MFS transporter
MSHAPSPVDPTATPATFKTWLGLAVLVLPTILLALDMTVLHLAVPRLSAHLRPSGVQLLWILDIYGFLIASFLITMGTLGDRIGRRKLLLIGAGAFGLASVLAAFSTSAPMLIALRALLGVAGATLMPSTLSLIRNMFHVERERTLAITVWMTGFIFGSAIGPLVGGVLLQYFWWGSVFLLGVPVMALLLATGPFLLPEFRDEKAGRLDLTSAFLSVTTLLTVIYGLKTAARDGFSAEALIAIIIGLFLGHTFVRRQQRLADPMLDLALFTNRQFSTSVIALLLTILALSGAWLLIFQFLQGVLGFSPLKAGLFMLPPALLQVAVSALVPTLSQRVRPATLVSAGLTFSALGMVLIAWGAYFENVWVLVTGSTTMGLGVMPMMILGTDMVVSAAPPEKTGAASATSETASELGMALGVAVIGSVGMAVYRATLSRTLPAGLTVEQGDAARETLGGALALAASLTGEQGETGAALTRAVRHAFATALTVNASIGIALLLLTATLVFVRLRHLGTR